MEKCIREGIKPSPKGVKMKLYIAYGSNTNRNSMAVRCPDAKYIGKSKLENKRRVKAFRYYQNSNKNEKEAKENPCGALPRTANLSDGWSASSPQ